MITFDRLKNILPFIKNQIITGSVALYLQGVKVKKIKDLDIISTGNLPNFKSLILVKKDNFNLLDLYLVHEKYKIVNLELVEIDGNVIIDSYDLYDDDIVAHYRYVDDKRCEFTAFEDIEVEPAFLMDYIHTPLTTTIEGFRVEPYQVIKGRKKCLSIK